MDLRTTKVTIVNSKKKVSNIESYYLNQSPPDRKADGTASRLQVTQYLLVKGVFYLFLKTAIPRNKIFLIKQVTITAPPVLSLAHS